MASQRDVKSKIGSVKNIQKITRAMEMVAAARLRRAEQRISGLRPYANAIRRMRRQTVTHERLLPLAQATIAGEQEASDGEEPQESRLRAMVEYEPDPEEILRRLLPDYVEISVYRALVESTAGFFGAQMTAMRSASENAGEIITEYTLQMNRARQAEITQEIMEVVAGAEGLA